MSYCDTEAIEAINTQKKRRETWEAFSNRLYNETGIRVNRGLLCAVWHGKKRSDTVRVALGLKPLKKRQPLPCSDCGEFHTVAWCIKQHGEPQPPKPTYNNRKKQIRLAASVTEEQRGQLRALADCYGMSWSELCQGIADGQFWPIEPK